MALVACAYAAVTALLFRDLLARASTHLYSDLGDSLLNTSILAWNADAVPLSAAWWNFPGYAPVTGVTSFTEHLLLTYPVASPVVWLTGNPILAYNVVFLTTIPLNALAAFALARELTGSRAAAFIAGLAFAFAPYQAVHLAHLQYLTAFGMPIALLWLHRYLRTGRRSALIGFGAGWFATALANSAMLVFFPVFVALWCVWFIRPHEWRRAVGPLAVAVIALLPLVPLLWGYHVRHEAYGIFRGYEEIRSFSADMIGVFGMYHNAWSWRGVLPHGFEEGALFPGMTIALLAVTGVIAVASGGESRWSRRLARGFAILTLVVLARIWTGPWGWHVGPIPLPPFSPYVLFTPAAMLLAAAVIVTPAFQQAWSRRDMVIFYASAAVAMWLLALGPEPEWSTPWKALAFGPYRVLYELPGVASIRVPARAWLLASLALAMLAAFGTRSLVGRYPRYARTMLPGLALLIVAEGAHLDVLVEVPPPMRRGAIPEGALVLDLPMEEGYQNALPQYRGLRGGYRTINGYSGYEPPHVQPLRRMIADMQPGALDAYRRREALFIIIRPDTAPDVVVWLLSHPEADRVFDLPGARIIRLPQLH